MAVITIDQQRFQRDIDRLEREFRSKPAVIARVINATARRTAKGIKTEISKGIREKVNLKKADVDDKIVIRTRGSNISVVLMESYRFGLNRFGARQTRKGVSYRISKQGGRTTIPGAFIVESKGGNVFRRTGESRLPIQILRGLSPWGAYVQNDGLDERIRDAGSERFQRELVRRIDREITKRAGRSA